VRSGHRVPLAGIPGYLNSSRGSQSDSSGT
jgi:hypothetical protein